MTLAKVRRLLPELLIAIWGVIVMALGGAALYAAIHFVMKYW